MWTVEIKGIAASAEERVRTAEKSTFLTAKQSFKIFLCQIK